MYNDAFLKNGQPTSAWNVLLLYEEQSHSSVITDQA